MRHQIYNGHLVEEFAGTWTIQQQLSNGEKFWSELDTNEMIMIGSYGAIRAPLVGGGWVTLTMNEAMWLGAEAGMEMADLGEGRIYISALRENFIAECADSA